jgi:4-hydroxybutyrate CoA-transferase
MKAARGSSERRKRKTVDWKDYYRSRQLSAQQAASLVKPGMRVHFPLIGGSVIQRALAARAEQIGGQVDLRLASPMFDPGWFSRDLSSIFKIEFEVFIGNVGRACHDQKFATYLPNLLSTGFKTYDERPAEDKPIDIAFINTSAPTAKGFVSFGPHQWNKRMYVKRARYAVAEVDPTLIRPHGDVYMHVSEFDYFVDGTPPPPDLAAIERELARLDEAKRAAVRKVVEEAGPERILPLVPYLERTPVEDLRVLLGLIEPPEEYKAIAGYLGEVIEDGATIQIGVGNPSTLMPRLGAFDKKHNLGLHSELVAPGIARLVDAGIINGRHKTIHPGKAVAVAWTGSDPEDLRIIDDNPAFELYDPEYLLDIGVVRSNHKQTSINNALSVDLTGQINAETVIGARMMNGTGGQPEAHIGAFLSKGGRAITLLPSTALNGAVSRIVPQFEEGALITIPRYFADTIITEYGVARLLGKNHRERASELIAVAHPDHRKELREGAKRVFG